MNTERLVAPFLLCLLAILPVGAQAQATSESPFMPTGGAAPAAAQNAGNHELVGMISSGKQILVGIADRTSRKSQWIPVGRTVDGIEVVSCDPKQDRAVIRVNGETKTLALRAAPTPSAPAVTVTPAMQPAPTPVLTSTQPVVATKQAEQEREARMLVSDLLEIGIQQRKAYEEAQKKAAAQKAGTPVPEKK